MKETIIAFIEQNLINGDEIAIGPDDDLLSSGVLDSLSAMKLIGFIEETYQLKVAPEDMVIENFMDVNSMLAYINTKSA